MLREIHAMTNTVPTAALYALDPPTALASPVSIAATSMLLALVHCRTGGSAAPFTNNQEP